MSEEVDIQISEFLDGELDESRLSTFLERYGNDRGLRERFSRYVVTRECLRRTRPLEGDSGFADRVMEALADEPVVLAPRRRTAFSGGRARRMLKPAAGLAVAASVATVAVLGLRGDNIEDGAADAPTARMSQPLAAESGGTGPRSSGLQYADAQVRQPMAQTVGASDRAWLNDYLLRHKEAAGFVGRSGFMPYVHIVATEAPVESEPARSGNDSERPLRRLPVNTQPE